MSDSKVFMFPETGTTNNGLMSLLAPLLSQRGVDPNILLAMNRNCGFGDAALGNLINNDSGREMLMSAIQGNGNAINQLASTLNCDINSVKSAINGIMSQIQGVGNQVGMSSQQIINAIQQGNCQIASKLADCCCENRLAICQQTNTIQNSINGLATSQEKGFSSVAYETQRQTCDIQNSIKSATDAILAGQRDAEMREMQNKIDALREANSQKDVIINNGQQTAVFNSMIQAATAPITNAVNALQGDINGIKCKLPETVTLPANNNVAVPISGIQLGFPYSGISGWGNICNNSLWG